MHTQKIPGRDKGVLGRVNKTLLVSSYLPVGHCRGGCEHSELLETLFFPDTDKFLALTYPEDPTENSPNIHCVLNKDIKQTKGTLCPLSCLWEVP